MARHWRKMREAETDRIVVDRLEMADTLWKQSAGLLGRKSMDPDTGLWLEPCNAIHTFGMQFPIDVLFLDRNGMLLRAVSHLRSWRIAGPIWKARTVVELPAGTIQAQRIQTGRRYLAEA